MHCDAGGSIQPAVRAGCALWPSVEHRHGKTVRWASRRAARGHDSVNPMGRIRNPTGSYVAT